MKIYLIFLVAILFGSNLVSAIEYCNGTIITINETNSTLELNTSNNTIIPILIPINETIPQINLTNESLSNQIITNNTNQNNCNIDIKQLCNQLIKTNETLPPGYCNISLSLATDKLSYQNNEKISIYNQLSNKSYNFTIDYWIEDDKGNILKDRLSTTNVNTKQYTPSLQDNTTIVMKNNLTSINCNNINNNTYNELKVFVEVKKSPIANISLDKLYINRSKKINIGENLTATISAYSGNYSSYPIEYFIDNITNSTQYIINNQFNYTTFNLTTTIPKDCNIKTNNYTVSIKSLNNLITQNITILNNCINTTNTNSSNTILTPSIFYNTTNYPPENIIKSMENTITGDTVYESTSVKAKKIAIYLTLIILLGLFLTAVSKNKTISKTIQKWYSQLEQL